MIKTKEQIIETAKNNGLILKEETLKFNESGLDFLVVIGTDISEERWVLRIPRRQDVLPSTAKEKKTLDLIEPRISIQVPKWEIFTEELIAYRLLMGVPAGTIDPVAQAYVWEIDEKNVPDMFNRTLAKAMVSLHQIDQLQAKSAGLVVESPEKTRKLMEERMESVKAEFGVSKSLWDRWQKWIMDDSFWPQKTGLIHGDLHPGHILIDDNACVTGFIDWTEASVTDISRDFVGHYRTFGDDALKSLIMYYESSGGYTWPSMAKHIVELAAAYPVDIAEFALKSGIEEYYQMTRKVLGVE